MFLIERMIGVTIFCVVLLFVFQMIVTGKIKYKKMLNIYLVLLTIMAYFYVPYKTADLYRIYEIVDIISKCRFEELVQYYLINNSSPAMYLVYWVFGRIGIGEFLPAVVCFIVYYILFYIIKIFADKYEMSKESVALSVFFLMSTGSYIMVISNMRTMLALALICYCYTKETLQNKFNVLNIVLYIVSMLTHNLAVVVVALRIVAFVIRRKKKISSYLITVVVMAAIGVLAIRYGGFLLDSVTEKALSYIGGEGYSYIWDYILGTMILLIELYVLYLYKKTGQKETIFNEYRKYIGLTIITAIVFCMEFSIYHRLITYFCPMLIMPVSLYIIDNIKIKRRARYNIIFAFSLAILLLSCFRGSMCSLKFFEL